MRELETLSEIKDFIHERQSIFYDSFLSARTNSSQFPSVGWEMVYTLPSGLVVKRTGEDILEVPLADPHSRIVKEGAVFTGKGYCETVSTTIYDGLASSVDKDKIRLTLGYIGTDRNRENWDRPDYQLEYVETNHAVIKITEIPTQKVMYADATYGQVDHRYKGKVVIVSETDFASHYRTASGQRLFEEFSAFALRRHRSDSKTLRQPDRDKIRDCFMMQKAK